MSTTSQRKRGISVTLLEKSKQEIQSINLPQKNKQNYVNNSFQKKSQSNFTTPPNILNPNTNISKSVYESQAQVLDSHIKQLQLEIIKARTRLSQINYVNTQRKVYEFKNNQINQFNQKSKPKSKNFSLHQIKDTKGESKSLFIQSKVEKVKPFILVQQKQVQKQISAKRSKKQNQSKSVKKISQFNQKSNQQTLKKKITNKPQQERKQIDQVKNNKKNEPSQQKCKLNVKKNKSISNSSINKVKKIKPDCEFNFFNNSILTKLLKWNEKPLKKQQKIKQKNVYSQRARPKTTKRN